MFTVFLGLGSNLGDRAEYLRRAVQSITEVARIRQISSVYETEPFGVKDQPFFLNIAVEAETHLLPAELLRALKAIEIRTGRTNAGHMQPREIDLDILLYEGMTYADAGVMVPHPDMHRRRFVLEPLNEIAPNAVHPVLGASILALLTGCSDRSAVKRVGDIEQNRISQSLAP